MSKSAYVGARVDPALKAEVEEICDALGLSLSQAITLFLVQVRQERGLPFQVRLPSPATRRAIEQAQDPGALPGAGSPGELYEDLGL